MKPQREKLRLLDHTSSSEGSCLDGALGVLSTASMYPFLHYPLNSKDSLDHLVWWYSPVTPQSMPLFSVAFIISYNFVMFDCLPPLYGTQCLRVENTCIAFISTTLCLEQSIHPITICHMSKESTHLGKFDSKKQIPWVRKSWILISIIVLFLQAHMGLSSNHSKRRKEGKSVVEKRTELWGRGKSVLSMSLDSYSSWKIRFFKNSKWTWVMRIVSKFSEPEWSMPATYTSLQVTEYLAKPLHMPENPIPSFLSQPLWVCFIVFHS